MNKFTLIPKNIKNINHNLINELNTLYPNIDEYIINIIKYINKCKHKLNNLQKNILINTNSKNISKESTKKDTLTINDTFNDFLSDTLQENNLEYSRIIPPYTIFCSYSQINGCLKKAAFKHNINKKNYCWFHVNCNNLINKL